MKHQINAVAGNSHIQALLLKYEFVSSSMKVIGYNRLNQTQDRFDRKTDNKVNYESGIVPLDPGNRG
jgi:hypothetical protein